MSLGQIFILTAMALVAVVGIFILVRYIDRRSGSICSALAQRPRAFRLLAITLSVASLLVLIGSIMWIVPRYHLGILGIICVSLGTCLLAVMAWMPAGKMTESEKYGRHFLVGAVAGVFIILCLVGVLLSGYQLPLPTRIILLVTTLYCSMCYIPYFFAKNRQLFLYFEIPYVALIALSLVLVTVS